MMNPVRMSGTFMRDKVWSKVLFFSMIVFLIRLSDAIISYWAPNQILSSLNNATLMGIIISFQSVVGFSADLIFPVILRTTSTKRLIFLGLITSGLTAFFLGGSVIKPIVAIFLVTMSLWGLYYEFMMFAGFQFMGSTVPSHMRSAAWGVVGVFVNLAYFLGPLIAVSVLTKNYLIAEGIILVVLLLAFFLLSFFKGPHEIAVYLDVRKVNPWIEIRHWLILSKHIWPAMIMSLLIGIIDSTFWTTGAIWTARLAEKSYLGGLFLPIFQLPAIFMGIAVAAWGIYKGKKILSEKLIIVSGIFLMGLSLTDSIPWQLSMVFLSSTALSVCFPLLEGVYTDIVARMGKEKDDLIGLTSSTTNVAYVIWPPVAGFLVGMVGEMKTFAIVGALVAVIAFILLFVTPKKLRLPEREIKTWH